MTDITERLRQVCETGCDPDLPYEAADEIDCLRARVAELEAARGEPVAWMRRWHHDGETPAKRINANGRMAWPFKFKLLPVTLTKALPDDVPLYTTPPAPTVDVNAISEHRLRCGAHAIGEELYPCADCGTMRTKAEGGTVFTVCGECWARHYGRLTA